jgi:hypothetical protein
VWSPTVPLPRSDHPEAHYYGYHSAISGDNIVIDADDATFDDADDVGAAYVYARSGSSWVQSQLLRGAPGGKNGFGGSVAINGDTLLVGGSLGESRGAAYVFVHEQTWVQQGAPLVSPSPGPLDKFGSWDGFGSAVAVSGDTAVVGASNQIINGVAEGAAFVFVRQAGVWAPQGSMLAAPDGSGIADFGATVAIDGDTILVGAPHNPNLDSVGTAYIFVRNAGQWSQQGPALKSGLPNDDYFSYSVSLSGDTALVGARSAFDQEGAAYFFSRSAGVWKQQGAALRPLHGLQASVGTAVAIQGDRAIVAAADAAPYMAPRTGALFVYTRRASGAWSQQVPADQVADQSEDLSVGQSVGLSGDVVVVGALGIQEGHGAAFALQVCADPASCQQVTEVGAAGASGAAGAGGEAGLDISLGGAVDEVGGSLGVAGSDVATPNTGGANTGGANTGGSHSGSSSVGLPVGGSNAGGAAAISAGSNAVTSDTASACGCHLAERRTSPARAWTALALLGLPCMLRRRLRGAIAKGQPKS